MFCKKTDTSNHLSSVASYNIVKYKFNNTTINPAYFDEES